VNVTLRKAQRVLREGGAGALLRKGPSEITGLLSAYKDLRRAQTFDSSADLVRYGQGLGNGVVSSYQVESEISSFLDRLSALDARVIVEIGTAKGGTLLLLARSAHPHATLISVDLPDGSFGEGYPVWRIPVYRRFALPTQTLTLIRADSHLDSTRERVRTALEGRQIDLLFIDGDHSYEGVRSDFEDYSPLVRAGGLIAFHDIVEGPPEAVGGVPRFWKELRERLGGEEIVADRAQGTCGIGVIRNG
jgi:predicted O-methyltransferase YrrM